MVGKALSRTGGVGLGLGWGSFTSRTWILGWLLHLFASYSSWVQLQSLALPPDTTVHQDTSSAASQTPGNYGVSLSHSLSFLNSSLLIQTPSNSNFKSKLSYERRSVGQSLLVSGCHLRPATTSSSSCVFSDICGFLLVGHPR
jgi:hypothetical protein